MKKYVKVSDMATNSQLEEAFTSMLRTDYISLGDTEKLQLLGDYYVDYFGYLSQIVNQTDQLIVGRRGTGKTTLMYRALVECMRSWDKGETELAAKSKTLGIYIDLSKCQSIYEDDMENPREFEHIFVTELCQAIEAEIIRSWPEVRSNSGILTKIFKSAEAKQVKEVQESVKSLGEFIQSGVPQLAQRPITVKKRDRIESVQISDKKLAANISSRGGALTAGLGGEAGFQNSKNITEESESEYQVLYRLTVQDLIRILEHLRSAAQISSILIFVDEFSSLSEPLQRRFTTLLRKILGNHSGIYIKLGAITDNYTLGSSIILQRDLFELSLDLDAYISRSASLPDAMDGLQSQVEQIVRKRLFAYANVEAEKIFEDCQSAWIELGRAAMGVPRTLGIILQQASHRSNTDGKERIRKSDLEFGIKYSSQAYEKQLIGAAQEGVAIPSYVKDLYESIIYRASQEAQKSKAAASHFMILPENESRLKYLNTFFVIHLLTRGRTTKKERKARNLYCIDYGICLEYNLGFSEDKNVIRQQRFVYDDILKPFDRYFNRIDDEEYRCPTCGKSFSEKELQVGGALLRFCPLDKTDLVRTDSSYKDLDYTEEEIKIIGEIRSAIKDDKLVASRIADDVGCYVQKVSKFGGKLEREGLISREFDEELRKHIYYGKS